MSATAAYASRQAPPGMEGVYLRYAHLNPFWAWFAGFIAAGYLLDASFVALLVFQRLTREATFPDPGLDPT